MLYYRLDYCFVGVLNCHVQRRYVVWVKVKRTYVRDVDDILLIRDQVSYCVVRFVANTASGMVIDLRNLVRTTPPRPVLMRIARANFSWRVPT